MHRLCSTARVAGDRSRIPNSCIPDILSFCRVIGNELSLLMSRKRNLQLLYDQLFGPDGRDEDDGLHVTSHALQAELHRHAAARPVIFDRPAGLHLFKSFVSQKQQVGLSTLFL